MLGRSSRPRTRDEEGGVNQPLLNDSDEDLPAGAKDNVLFSVDDGSDDDQEDELLANGDGHAEPGRPTVRFEENVQVIAPPLRSTFQSRETGA